MAIRKIARLGHPVLREKATDIPPEQIRSPEIQRLIDDMIETMQDHDGLGLAAPQVYESLRLFVTAEIHDPEDDSIILAPPRVVINPQVTFLTQEEIAFWEGCLSVPDLRGLVPRPSKLRITGYDRHGRKQDFEADRYAAIVYEHEYDHLDGIVFLDRMPDMKKLAFIREFSRYIAGPSDRVAD